MGESVLASVQRNMDETPVLSRHPLHTVHHYRAKLPQPVGKRDHFVVSSEGSETEGVSDDEVLIEDEKEWTPKNLGNNRSSWKDVEEDECEDMPSTQLIDPRPLAGELMIIYN